MSLADVRPASYQPQNNPKPQPLAPKTPENRQISLSEPATPEASEELKPKEEGPSRLALLAKKEAVLRRQAQELKREKEALAARQLEYEASSIPKSSLAERFKTDPLGLMTEHGVTYEQLTQAILNQPNPQNPEMMKIQQELKELKNAQSQMTTKAEEQQKASYEQALNQIRNDTKILIASDPEYEMIKETESSEAVVELIRETFEKTNQLLSVEEAAKEVENYLIEEAMKMAQLKKVKARLTPAEGIAEHKPEGKPASIKTLTHAQTGSSKPLTAYERAVLAFKGELK